MKKEKREYNKNKKISREVFQQELNELKEQAVVRNMEYYTQHKGQTKLSHVENVANTSFNLAEKLHWNIDEKKLAKGALLHDFYMYNATDSDISAFKHVKDHPKIALQNARKHFLLEKKEENIIRSHMWPLTLFHPPRSREALLVCAADKYCAVKEFQAGRKKGRKKQKV